MSVSIDQIAGRKKISRPELVVALRKRDGDNCQYPGAEHPLDFSILEGPNEHTIDHHIPQWYGKQNGWTIEQIWNLDNLRLMCKKHNAKKGDLIPNEDGTLPEKVKSNFKYRRQRRANRPDGPCPSCNNGHDLFVGEVCADCGMNAQRFPMSAKVRVPDCDHEILWCWMCSIGIIERPSASSMAVRQGESGEWGDQLT